MTSTWQVMKENTVKLAQTDFLKQEMLMESLKKRIVELQRNSINTLPMYGPVWPAKYKTHLQHLRIFYFPYRSIWNTETSLLKNLKKFLGQ